MVSHSIRIFSILLIFCVITEGRNLQFKQYNVEHGLRQSQVVRIAQLSTHEMVFSTVSGLSYYDGSQFYNPPDSASMEMAYSLAVIDSFLWMGTRGSGILIFQDKKPVGKITEGHGIPGNWVNDIIPLNGKIYVATNKGISILSAQDTVLLSEQEGLLYNVVLDLFIDKQGDIWYTTPVGFGVITPSGEIINVDGRGNFLNPFCEDILVDNHLHVWVGTRQGLLIFDKSDFLLHKSIRRPLWVYSPEIPEDYITTLAMDDFGDIWIGTKHGLLKYEYSSMNQETKGQIYLPQFIHFSLKLLFIKDIFVDVEKNIWVGTRGGGLFKIQGDIFWSFGLEDGLLNQEILSIAEDSSNTLWVGTNLGCARFDGYRFRTYTTKNGLIDDIVTCFGSDRLNRWWAGTWKGLSRFDGKNFVPYPVQFLKPYEQLRIYDIFAINDSLLWLATWDGLYQFHIPSGKYEKVEQFPELQSVNISEMKPLGDNILLFTTRSSVFVMDLVAGKIIKTIYPFDNENIAIHSARFLNTSDYVIGSNKGVFIYKNDSLAYHLHAGNYLLDNEIISVEINDLEDIWIGTNKGVSFISIKDDQINVKNYSSKNGFYGEEIITNHSMFQDHEGNMWFGTFLGLSKYIRYKDLPNLVPPKVYIKSIQIFKQEATGKSGVTLSYKENTITIRYNGISFRDEADVLYRYRLKGFQDEWSSITPEREAVFFNLPAGNYTFEVLARNRDGVWSEEPAVVTFTILAPFWETPAFIALSMVALLFLAFLLFRRKIRRVRMERDILEQKVVIRTKTLIEQQRKLLETNQQLKKLTEELQTSMDKLKTAQLQLIQSEKMASLGTLIAGVTHELNNPITFIYSNFESLKEYFNAIQQIITQCTKKYLRNDPEIKQIAEETDLEFILEDLPQLLQGIEYGANRIKNIVAQLYRFSHPGTSREKLDIHENIELTLNLFMNQYRRYITVHKEYDDLPVVEGSPGELNQVFLNLLFNAAYAIRKNRGEGDIFIKTFKDDTHVFVSIRDTGGGIPAGIQDKIFDPFFTTKPIGEGTGLGLSLSYNIIKNMNGDIFFKNHDDGAEFIIKLPIAKEEEE